MDDQMGRHNDYREPKRRGYDDDNTPADRFAGGRLNGPKPSAQQGWQSVDAVVKWFNPDKGLGFVAVDGGFDAFLHVRFLEAAGYSSLPAGARIKVQIGRGQKGPQVSAVIEVDTSTAQVGSTTAGLEPTPSSICPSPGFRREDRRGWKKGVRLHWARRRWQGRLRPHYDARARRIEQAGGRSTFLR